jgi:hypothetical protein
MRVFEGFNESKGKVCPVCKSAKNAPTVLVPIPGTDDGGNVECNQVHKECFDLVVKMNES